MKTSTLLYTLILSFLLISCASEIKQPETLDGVWQSVGYGRIVKIADGEFIMAETTAISCIPIMEGEIDAFEDALQLTHDTLSLKDGINTYYFTRLDDAPLVCKKDTPEGKEAAAKANDPEYNFEVLWETFKDHYAYFELRNINPKEMYSKYRPRVTQETNEVELFIILSEMLDEFDDGHIDLDAPKEVLVAARKLKQQQIHATLASVVQESNVSETNKKERLRKYNVSKAVADKYIPLGTSIKGGNLRWGILDGNVGYLQTNQMMAVAKTNLSDTLSYYDYMVSYFDLIDKEGLDTPEELAGMNTSLDKIMNDFKNTNAVIIDARFNGGGKDEVGMDILKRFNTEEKLVFTKKGKLGNGFTPTNKVIQPASKNAYKNPVFLLTSVESASATEIMILSSLNMPNVTRVGSSTEGVFSDVLDRVLPNEWDFGLSSEVYLDLNGNNYESIGISPDVEIGYSRDTQEFLQKVMADLENGGDLSIEKALALIRNN